MYLKFICLLLLMSGLTGSVLGLINLITLTDKYGGACESLIGAASLFIGSGFLLGFSGLIHFINRIDIVRGKRGGSQC